MDELAFNMKKKETDVVFSHMKKMIADEVKGKESQRKHLTVLKRIWVKIPDRHEGLRDRAIKIFATADHSKRLVIHWGMSLLAFPFFLDMAIIVGVLAKLQDDFTLKQVRQRIVEDWGDRSTLRYAIPRMLKTFSEWGALDMKGKGRYKTTPKITIDDKETLLWLLESYFYSIDEKIVYLDKLNKTSALFPFSYHVDVMDFFKAPRFEINRQGLSNDVVELKLRK